MNQLTPAQTQENADLLHHAVIKLDSLTTKCRVVFDGSGKDSTGVSLNDRLQDRPPLVYAFDIINFYYAPISCYK